MNWGIFTEDWRFKLLALGLAVLMLGAVAFSQNPPTSGSLTIPINYTGLGSPSNLILINAPSKTNVTYTGLAGLIKNVNSSNLAATVDVSHASPGPAVRLNVTVSGPANVIIQNPPPVVVNIDTRQGKDVPVTVNARAAPGWTITKHDARCGQTNASCTVHFDGPASWETNLQAYVDFPGFVSFTSNDSSNWPVHLVNSNGAIDPSSCHTQPCATLDQTSVSVHIEAVAGSTSSTVALLDSPPSHPPAGGYRITGITITPNTVIISGDPVALGKIRNITLPPVDLSGKTSDAVFQVAIPYPPGITGDLGNATVKYFISANPNASPSP